ncbi:MAG: oligosaccharide flippase family protein [Pseudomonadota bacterium]|nr:oligosaccharide flippase family protein [Pseudomonadota bacterium]
MKATGDPSAVMRMRKTLAASGLAVLIGTLAATTVIRLGSNLILTRLLAPEAFGVIGVLSSITVILQLFTDMGFGAFVVRVHEKVDKKFLNVIWTIRLTRNAALTAIMFASADLLAAGFAKPELATPIRAASFLFLVEGLISLHPMMAVRARRVSYTSAVDFAAFLIQLAATIAAAAILRSFWGILIGMYVFTLTKAVFSYALYPGGLHRLAFDRKISQDFWNFARLVVVSSIITIILGQADRVFIGRALSLEILGLYMLAVNFTSAARQLIEAYTNKIVFPLFAETFRQAPEKLDALFYSARRRMTLALAFLLGGGIGGGQLIIRILLDERYLDAGLYLSILCLGPLFLLYRKPAESLMFAKGRIRSTLESNIVRLIWIALAAPLGYYYFGVIGLVFAFALLEAAAAAYWVVKLKQAGILNIREELYILGAAGAGAAIGFGADRLAAELIASGVLPSF